MPAAGFRRFVRIALIGAFLASAPEGRSGLFGVPPGDRQNAQATAPEARAGRVEKGLLPGVLVAGRAVAPASITDRMAALKVPGVGVAVINSGNVEWARGYGIAESGSPSPVTPKTLFQAASISKSVATLAALRLVEQGKLALDEDVNARLTSWKVPENEFTAKEKVTLRRLLSHTAGLTVHGFGGYAAGDPVPSVVQVLDGQKPANSAAVRVEAVPGSRWSYSGGGFTVMQLLLTDTTGKPFPALLSELVLKPVGMNDSAYEQPLPASRRGAAATGHGTDGTPIAGRYHTYPEMAAAGLWTTPTDLALFLIELQKALRGQSAVVSTGIARRMTTMEKDGYGLGLSIQGSGAAENFGHGGSNEGFRCQMVAFKGTQQGAVVMTNGDHGGQLAQEVLRAIAREYGWPAYQPQEKRTVPVAPAALSALTGRYELRPGRILTVSLEKDTLYVIDGSQRIELFPESETRFFELVEETSVEFLKGPDGRATHMVINGRIKAPRVE